MFSYAFKAAGATPSKEDYVQSEEHTYPRSENAAPKMTFSDGAIHFLTKCSIRGLVYAFAQRMCLSGSDKDVVKTKLTEFIELARRSGDISREEAVDLKNEDHLVPRESLIPVCCRDTFGVSGYGMDLLNTAIGTYDWRFVPQQERKNMDPQELSILDNYEAASKAYFEADNIRRQYYTKKATAIINALLAKYGETLRLMDEELLTFLQERFKVETQTAE